MYRCSNPLRGGCLSVQVTQIRDPVVARIEDVGEHTECKVADAAEHIQACCSIVCSVNTTDKYLNVAPTVVWLTLDTLSGEFNVYSNVEWVIN